MTAPSTVELRAALEAGLRARGRGHMVTSLERRPSDYATSSALEELDVVLDDGTSLELMFKDLSPAARLEGARRTRPAFVDRPWAEIDAYRTVLARRRLGTATCHASVADPDRDRYWLFLERIRGVELYQIGELSVWAEVAGWLAVAHDRLAREVVAVPEATPWVRYDGDHFRVWMARALDTHRDGPAGPRLRRLAEGYEQVVKALLDQPRTFVHGELYASNVLVAETAGGRRVCPVDWEMAGFGPALIDLAALVAGTWDDEQREALTRAYYGAVPRSAAWPPPRDEFAVALDCCRLHLAVRLLGWSPCWAPPPEHAQDWLEEACRLGERLGL